MIPNLPGEASFRPLILSVLDEQDSYGYEIMQHVRTMSGTVPDLKPNVLYPLLRFLEQNGLIEGYWVHDEGKPPRKYYRLLNAGRKVLDTETQ